MEERRREEERKGGSGQCHHSAAHVSFGFCPTTTQCSRERGEEGEGEGRRGSPSAPQRVSCQGSSGESRPDYCFVLEATPVTLLQAGWIGNLKL